MINADSLPTSSSLPKPPQRGFGMGSDAPMGSSVPKAGDAGFSGAKLGQKTLFGFDLRSLATVAGLTLFFVVAMAGVVISMRTRFGEQNFSPTAPERPSADVIRTATCSLTFVVASPTPSPSTSPSPTPSPSASPSPTPSTSPSPTPRPTPSPTPLAECNYPCTNTVDCANVNHLCYQGRCRLIDNPTSSTCTMPGATPTPTPRPTATPVTVVPTYQCNENCVNNADCSNAAHICYNSRCRLADNPESATCSYPQGTQPELPMELPKTGSDGLETWLKAGLGVLGVGAVLLLLL
jgi:hypothetical protein